MVLADGIVLAGEKQPDAIVDIATLTGAQVMALGMRIGGLMANDDAFRDTVRAAADGAGEARGRCRCRSELRAGLDSPVADLASTTATAHGGMLTAGAVPARVRRPRAPRGRTSTSPGRRTTRAALRLHPQGRHRLRRPHAGRAGRDLRPLRRPGAPPADGAPEPRLPDDDWPRPAAGAGRGRRALGAQPLLRRNICCVALGAVGIVDLVALAVVGDVATAVRVLLVQRLAELALQVVARPCGAASGSVLGLASDVPASLPCAVMRTSWSCGTPLHAPGRRAPTGMAPRRAAQRLALAGVPLPHPLGVAGLADVVDGHAERAGELEAASRDGTARRVHSPSCAMSTMVVAVTLVGGST